MFAAALFSLAAQVATPATTAPVAAPAPAAASEVVVWRRGAGPAAKELKAASATVKLSALKQSERKMKDVRGKELIVRGTTLELVLAAAPAATVPGLEDTAILRFKNGTRVALALKDAATFDVFLATSYRMSEQGEWSTALEPVPLGNPHWASARALEFKGNRVLAGKADPPRGAGSFNPWGFVDTLMEVELVNAAAWRKVFAVGATDVEDKGLTAFENRCAACHGARGAGARLGWDFVEPLPVTTWRTPDSLYDHVRAHKLTDAELGLLMPPQPDITKEEIGALHAWMKRLSEKKLADYKP
jgi:mono/diheme cytochrome c family protein